MTAKIDNYFVYRWLGNKLIYIPYKPGVRRNEDGILEDEENFDEAVKSVNTALVPTKVSLICRKILLFLHSSFCFC